MLAVASFTDVMVTVKEMLVELGTNAAYVAVL